MLKFISSLVSQRFAKDRKELLLCQSSNIFFKEAMTVVGQAQCCNPGTSIRHSSGLVTHKSLLIPMFRSCSGRLERTLVEHKNSYVCKKISMFTVCPYVLANCSSAFSFDFCIVIIDRIIQWRTLKYLKGAALSAALAPGNGFPL